MRPDLHSHWFSWYLQPRNLAVSESEDHVEYKASPQILEHVSLQQPYISTVCKMPMIQCVNESCDENVLTISFSH